MFRRADRLLAVALSAILGGCTFVRTVHQDGGAPLAGRYIEQTEHEDVWLVVGARDDLADAAMHGLFAQCPGGRVEYVYSRLSTSHFIIMHRTTVHVSGRCLPASEPPRAPSAPPTGGSEVTTPP